MSADAIFRCFPVSSSRTTKWPSGEMASAWARQGLRLCSTTSTVRPSVSMTLEAPANSSDNLASLGWRQKPRTSSDVSVKIRSTTSLLIRISWSSATAFASGLGLEVRIFSPRPTTTRFAGQISQSIPASFPCGANTSFGHFSPQDWAPAFRRARTRATPTTNGNEAMNPTGIGGVTKLYASPFPGEDDHFLSSRPLPDS